MTRAKLPPHRLGFDAMGDRTRADVREFARFAFLREAAAAAPDLLASLDAVPAGRGGAPDAAALRAWARRHHLLADWVICYARASWAAWRQLAPCPRVWFDRADGPGTRWYRSRYGRQAARLRRSADHVAWLVAYQVQGRPLSECAPYAAPRHARAAMAALARFLGLRLRRGVCGRPPGHTKPPTATGTPRVTRALKDDLYALAWERAERAKAAARRTR